MTIKEFSEIENFMTELIVIETTSNHSKEFKKRINYKPPLCPIFQKDIINIRTTKQYKFKIDKNVKKQLPNITFDNVQELIGIKNSTKELRNNFALKKKIRIGVIFSGGPAPGGHNVIAGLFDALKNSNSKSSLFGFIMGPDGMLEGNYVELTYNLVNRYRNLGGFNMIKTARTKIDTNEKINLSKKTCSELNLDAIVIIGGDDSNTNAAFLAQKMLDKKINVIGVPKTIDGDIQVRDINNNILCATSFGFHTASKSFSHFVSNLCVDASSDAKYWHICKLMGRSASHLALEVAFQTHPNLTIIGEEIADYVNRHKHNKDNNELDYSIYGMTLKQLVIMISNTIVERARIGKNFGVIVIPEGILEFINEIQVIIIKLSSIIANYNSKKKNNFHCDYKSLNDKLNYLDSLIISKSKDTPSKSSIWNLRDNNSFASMPTLLQKGLLTKRDNHGNFQFSQVKIEEIFLNLIETELDKLRKKGKYKLGIDKKQCENILEQENLDKNIYGPILFQNWTTTRHVLFHKNIISEHDLTQILVDAKLLSKENTVPNCIIKLFRKSLPNFKAQTHFYGYDGRGSSPTSFDCTYAYNLGHTAFHLINNNATGQMASILNLDDNFDKWKPIGIPIAALMHLEERKGNLSLVLEKSLIDIESPSFKIFKKLRQKWLATNQDSEEYRITDTIQIKESNINEKPITLIIECAWKKYKNTKICF